MFNPLSVFNPNRLFNVGLAFMTGGMSLYMQLAREFITMAGAELIQRLGTRLGLPQAMIDMATSSYLGQFSNPLAALRTLDDAAQGFAQVGYTPQQVGDALRETDDSIARLVRQTLAQARSIADGEDFRAAGGTGGKSFLVALGIALGKALDQKLNRMFEITQELADFGEITKGNESKYGALTGELNAQGQIAGMLSQALNNAIKAVGDASQTLARRN